ncbi:MAG: YraN family protein [Elainellaceae cyanobacterium]
MPSPKRQRALQRGQQGEAFVARVLESWGWSVLHRRWHCRWGEIDLVAQDLDSTPDAAATLVFVEVKVRSSGAWDDQGLAVTWRKQQRLWQAARHFLMTHEATAHLPCRFDVALVQCRPARRGSPDAPDGYSLQRYIKGAFDVG